MSVLLTLQGQTLKPGIQANLYDPNPLHIWNRLYKTLCVREDGAGNLYGVDAIDLLLWDISTHLLSGVPYRQALNILDEFLQTNAENQIRDPLKKALLQHNLWAVFDWSSRRREQFPAETRELQIRLAEVMRRLALTANELKLLSDNYAEAVAAGTFAKEFDPSARDRSFLPPDLVDPHGPWVRINANVVALSHIYSCSGRSNFIAFINLPQGNH